MACLVLSSYRGSGLADLVQLHYAFPFYCFGMGCVTTCGEGYSSDTANRAYEFGIEFLTISIEIHSKMRLESRICHSNFSLA
jgi:hypothetical protein